MTASPDRPPVPDAEALYQQLRQGVTALITADTQLVGVPSGGAWLAERLTADLQRPQAFGVVSSALHRDDFAQRGMSSSGQTRLPFEVDGADILLLDDVLYTGRTLRAVLNELFDYGRPARVRLAVLADRGGRQLPIAADLAAATLTVPEDVGLRLARHASGQLVFEYAPKLR
ncbi:bifunctional pyr operon transcriptional regulator/uracil phosphoribosyltransferase [Comamonas serinivorans]|uniref:Bifunctional pyr operon transcriptional regulator/uracil phosphoribosyltransferase n=1 Tax=Comamonas serinivorans TaxID=1082851 RepID=A0A1Y0ELK8_9BURK|nr:bifunctional pyr operon transcriptional regulator/uracil phosphoribosyltransferase PyrR [Comamonas serinivorans]ARU04534.1 bifunctional pyr operon transcriptional regulator/uracil phosphoribosyltransferase [Comamonas serinivorans]